ncbi:MAG: pentapeptide repeat-containing protein, partial [Tolypothrix sp. Co-bin9]|nr:pentapeptide repeat-containing protein [Tolypothrix sp. Co-bin9]
NTDFTNASLQSIYLLEADLRGADFNQTSFENVIYDARTQLPEGFSPPESGMYLLAAYSSAVGIRGYKLDLAGQDLTGLDISDSEIGADFSRATLDKAIFENGNFFGSVFLETSLINSRFCNARLRGTDLTRANLQGADLRGTDLRRAGIEDANFQNAIYNADTRFPEGFDPVAAGAILFNESCVSEE